MHIYIILECIYLKEYNIYLYSFEIVLHIYKYTHTHTHTHTHIYIYICVCVCVGFRMYCMGHACMYDSKDVPV